MNIEKTKITKSDVKEWERIINNFIDDLTKKEKQSIRLARYSFQGWVQEYAAMGFKDGFYHAVAIPEDEIPKINQFYQKYTDCPSLDNYIQALTLGYGAEKKSDRKVHTLLNFNLTNRMMNASDMNYIVYLFSWIEGAMEYFSNYKGKKLN